MALNFRIFHLKSKNSVHLTLNGDFDGASAFELINAVKGCSSDIDQVFINTNGIKAIYSFGTSVLYNNLSDLTGQPFNLIFIGDKKNMLSNPWSTHIDSKRNVTLQ